MKTKTLFIVGLLLFGNKLLAQRETTSPFSRYGYGDLYTNTTAYNQAMGGISVGLLSPTQINFGNPAHQSNIKKETFLFNVGMGADIRKAEENNISATQTSVGVESISLAFPIIADHWGCAVGMLPFNSVGYNMNYTDSLAEYSYKGEGGINQFALSTGVQVFKGFSLGANLAYLFGTTNYMSENYFTESSAFYSRKDLEYKTIGFLWGLGLQYNWKINEEKTFTLGTTWRKKQSLSYKETETFNSYIISGVTEIGKDTVIKAITRANTDIPTELALGIGFKSENKYQIGIDAGLQNWENISCYGTNDKNLTSTKFIKIGGELIPDYKSTKFYKRVPLRLGAHYADLPSIFTFEGTTAQVKEYGVTLGTQISSKHTRNSLALALDFGTRGNKSLAKSLHETYMQIKINVTLQEVWFNKRKIN